MDQLQPDWKLILLDTWILAIWLSERYQVQYRESSAGDTHPRAMRSNGEHRDQKQTQREQKRSSQKTKPIMGKSLPRNVTIYQICLAYEYVSSLSIWATRICRLCVHRIGQDVGFISFTSIFHFLFSIPYTPQSYFFKAYWVIHRIFWHSLRELRLWSYSAKSFSIRVNLTWVSSKRPRVVHY